MKKVYKFIILISVFVAVVCSFCVFSSASTYDVSHFNVDVTYKAYFKSTNRFVNYYKFTGITLPYDKTSYTIPHLYGYSPFNSSGVWNSPYSMYFTTRDKAVVYDYKPGTNITETSVRFPICTFDCNLNGCSYDISNGSMIIRFDFLVESQGMEDADGKFIYAFEMEDYPTDIQNKVQPVENIKINNLPILNVSSVYYKIERKYHTEYPVGSSNGGMDSNVYSFTLAFPISEESIKERYGDTLTNFSLSFNMVSGTVSKDPTYVQFEMLCTPISFEMSGKSIDDVVKELTEEINKGTDKIIENNNANTDKITANQDKNADKITANQDKNTDKITDSIDNAIDNLNTPSDEQNAIIGRTDDLSGTVDNYLSAGMNTIIVDLGKYASLDPSLLPLNEYKELFNLFLSGNILILFTTVLSIGFVLRLVFGSLPDLFARAGNRENKKRSRDSTDNGGGDS